MLQLSGDQDGGLPLPGIQVLERKLAAVYALHDRPKAFRSVVYRNTAHEYLPELRREMPAWFDQHLRPRRR